MKKYSFLFLLVILFTGCSDSPKKINTSTAAKITATEAKYYTSDTALHYEINLVYPVIDANTTPDILNRINNTIPEKFHAFIDQQSFIEAHQNLPEHFYDSESEWLGILQNSYGITQCDSTIHIWFSVYEYYIGAAHGSTLNHSLHFNINTGELLTVKDFLKTDKESLMAVKSIFNRNLPDSICWGIQADSNILKNMAHFVFNSDSITFKINDYSLCPYAFGLTNITFPVSDFKDVFINQPPMHCIDVIAVVDEGEIATH